MILEEEKSDRERKILSTKNEKFFFAV